MEWKEAELESLLEALIDYRGKTPHKTDSGIPLITAKIIKNGAISEPNEFIAENDYDSWMVRGFPKEGDVVLTTEAPLGEVAQLDHRKIALAQRVVCLRGKKGLLDNTYLKYYFLSSKGHLALTARETGTTVTGIKQSELRKVMVTFPIYETQRRIANILSSLDRKIELNNKLNAQLEEMAQTLFKHWFVDFGPFKDGKFVESELGMIPEGWRVGTLTEIVELLPGGTPKTSEPSFWENGDIPFFSPKDVTGTYCFFTEKQITKLGLSKCSSRLYPKDTVFITCRGTVGKVTLAACNMAMNQSNYAIKGRLGYSQYYIYFLVKSVVERLIKKSNGAVFSAITTKDFDEKVIIPSVESVERFTKMISSHFDKLFSVGQENIQLASLRDTLLPKLMSGEINLEDYGGE